MIYEISSSLSTFKHLKFGAGLNVVLADKSQGATDMQTRNSSGKTSIIAIIHFLLGASCEPSSIFRSDKLGDELFSLSFDLGGQQIRASRSGNDANQIIVDGNLPEWPEQPTLYSETEGSSIPAKKWKVLLGASVFGIADQDKYAPRFRSMISYFVRREWDGGFFCAEKNWKNQQPWNVQVNLSYLLGLDWVNGAKLQEVRDKENTLKLLKKDSSSGVLGSLVGSTGELRTKLTVAETALTELRRQLEQFQVLPEYRELEQEASGIAIKISEASNENALDRERIKAIELQLDSEEPAQSEDIAAMYKEAEIVLPDLVAKQIEDVERFHQRVIRNRLAHLEGEINAANKRIETRRRELAEIDRRRREIMNTLSSHGAIDQMTRLEEEKSRRVSLVEDLRKRLELTEKIESTKTELTIERAQVRQAFTLDHREHESVIREAILIFEEFSKAISSDHEGSLTIDITDNGPTFSIQVEGGRSVGIRNMQIFCFDMMLSVIWSRRNRGPGFLVHDSHLFDGMDSRQIAKAIEIGARQSEKNDFQYIVTMNSDMVPRDEFSNGFEFDEFVNPVRLSDETETGGLFGVRL